MLSSVSIYLESTFQRKDGGHDRSHPTCVDQPADLAELRTIDLDHEPDGSPAVAAFALRRTRHSDGNESAAWAQHAPRPLPCLAADRVEHEILVSDGILESSRPVVDHLVGAEPSDEVGVAPRACRRHVGASPSGELNRERADAPGAAVDENPLAAFQVTVLEERLPGRLCRQRDDRGLYVGQGGRLREQLVGANRDELGVSPIAAVVDQAEHRIADLDAGGVARRDRLYHSGEFVSWNDGRCARCPVMAEPCQSPVELGRRNATGVNPDEYIARSQRRNRRILDDQSGRVTVSVSVQGAHGAHLLLASGLAVRNGPDDTGIHSVRPFAQPVRG